MAAVTVNTVKHNVTGNVRSKMYNIAGDNAGTLVVGLLKVLQVVFDPGVISAYAATPGTNNTNSIAFTASGAFTNTNVTVIGY